MLSNKKQRVAMIPARMGSQRVKQKNLRLIEEKPLIWYAIQNCKKSGLFDAIYVNSESDIIGNYALEEGVSFYKRPEHLASNSATNDGFALDFMNAIECDTVIQVNPTSPFISEKDIRAFVDAMESGAFETMHSVKAEQIEGLFNRQPLNFDPLKPMPPSQELTPVEVFSSGIMGFRCDRFRANMEELGCAVYGGKGKTGYFRLKGYSTVDIDNEEDFILAEAIARSMRIEYTPKYYTARISSPNQDERHNVQTVLTQDGVDCVDLTQTNQPQINLDEIKKTYAQNASWAKRVINTAGYSATFIFQQPGQGNRAHHHPDRDEWWIVFEGAINWTLPHGQTIHAIKNDLVFVPKGTVHEICVVGDQPAIRLAISVDGMEHVFI